MGRKPLSDYPSDIAAKIRADIVEKNKKAWENRQNNGYGVRKNVELLPEVQDKISKSVHDLWKDGSYEKRINGMLGRKGSLHHATSENLLLWAWQQLESIGLKGLTEIEFAETDGSSSIIRDSMIIESYGWEKLKGGKWEFVCKNGT